jgi:eukaryotic-like serine/threonine-protein kinase
MLTGQLPFRANDRETLLEMQRTAQPPRPSTIRRDCHQVAERIVLRLLEKDPRKRYRDGHHLLEELKALQRSLPSTSWDKENAEASMVAPPPPPPPRSPGVTEWASRTGLFARMVSRAYPSNNAPKEVAEALASLWDISAKANSLEGEVASHTRKLEALERRGRALRAEIGRKVEELAQEESRALREAASRSEEENSTREALVRAERNAQDAVAVADQAEQAGRGTRQVFEAAGAARALVDAKREHIAHQESRRVERETYARDLRRQIEELRSQLGRYAEALDEDLAQGREKVAARAREGLRYEKTFTDGSAVLLSNLKGKPECRDLLNELTSQNSGSSPNEGGASESSHSSAARPNPPV